MLIITLIIMILYYCDTSHTCNTTNYRSITTASLINNLLLIDLCCFSLIEVTVADLKQYSSFRF